MTRLQTLAAAPRPLADVLVDALRRSVIPPRNDRPDADEHAGGERQCTLPFATDDRDDADDCDKVPVLPPGEIAAAILLGQALDPHRDALARLQDADAITIIEVPAADFVEPIERLLRQQVIGIEACVLDRAALTIGLDTIARPGTIAIFTGQDDGKGKKDATGSPAFAAAMQRRCGVIGIAADPDRSLPRDLVRLAGQRIIVAPFDGAAVAAIVEAVTGRPPGPVDDALARHVTLGALNVAVRADLGAGRSLERLRRLLDGGDLNAEPAPLLSEMHGLGAARDWGLSLIHDLRDYAAGRLPWSAVDRGCLLSGAPGTGKTSFARALAQEACVHFAATSYSQWQSYKDGHLGSVTQAIRNVVAEAQQHRPSILFVDEIDTLPARGSGKWNDDWWTSITNTLLECLDGFDKREGVVVIAACNDPSRLDPALVRAGRLDRHIEIPRPDLPALSGILRAHLGNDLPGVDLRAAALAARGHTGADIERVVREARRHARRHHRALLMQDLLDAIRGGAPDWPAALRRRVAYHEAGHAIATVALGVAEPLALSINAAGGLAESGPGEIRALTRAHLENHLIALMAGRASEQLIFGEPTAGAGGGENSDLALATGLALRLETAYGLGSLGMVWAGHTVTEHDLLLLDDLRAAVRRTIDAAYATALDLITTNRRALAALAEALFASGYLERREIDAVLKAHPPAACRASTQALREDTEMHSQAHKPGPPPTGTGDADITSGRGPASAG